VPATILGQLNRALPEEDPLCLQANEQRLTISRFSIPCERGSVSAPAEANAHSLNSNGDSAEETEGASRARSLVAHEANVGEILAKAASILKPYRISEADLKSLVEKHLADTPNPFSSAEAPVIKCVAQVWSLLAPLGIEPNEIKALIDDSIKNALKR
jgi:hypothetical protein